MKPLLFALACLLPGELLSEGADAPLANPKALSGIVAGLEKSEVPALASKATGGENDTYHLKSVDLLGALSRGKEDFFVVSAFYIRSRPWRRESPPARGHDFIVILRSDFSVVAYGRAEVRGCHMTGDVLMTPDRTPLIDFGKTDPLTRGRGYFIGDGFLPYFFSDRLSEEQMEAKMGKQKGD